MENAFHRQTDRQTDRQRSERNSSIELLRMLAGMAVVVLHFNFGGVGAVESTTGVIQHVLLMLEAICACAVNVFLLISGYCSAFSRKINTGRLLQLLLQTCVFGVMVKIISAIIHSSWPLKSIIGGLLPVNYYVILYISLMLVAPYINLAINNMGRKSTKTFIIITMFVFSIYPTAVDLLEDVLGREYMGLNSIGLTGSGGGYTIINFILIYVIGACIRKMNVLDSVRVGSLLVIILISAVCIYGWHLYLPDTAYMYCNPLLIGESVTIFMLFAKMNYKSRIINFIAPASFTCFLIHSYLLVFWSKRVTIADMSSGEVILWLLVVVLGIYLLSIMVMIIWNKIVDVFLGKYLYKMPIIRIEEV